MKETDFRDLLEANSVVLETENGKVTAIYIEEVLKCAQTWLTERKQHYTNRHHYCDDVKTSMNDLLKRLKCDACHVRYDCSVVNDPKDCVLEVPSDAKKETENK
jgi:hypothetical protein